MKKICMTFLSCVSIIGSAQCLYTPGQEMPMAEELHAEETNQKIIDIDTSDTSHISPEFVQLTSMKIDGEMNEEDTGTIDHLLTEKAIELADKGDKDFFHAAIVHEERAEDIQAISNEKPAVMAKSTEAEDTTIFEEAKVEPSATETEEVAEAKLAESEPVEGETTEIEETVAVSEEEEEEEEAEEPAEATEETTEPSAEESVITVTATAYTADCEGGSGVTYTGVDLKANPDAKVIAVDPSVIPLGTEVYVEGYGHAVAADIGGAIKGNKIDVFIPSQDAAESWGVQTVDVTIMH